LDGDPKNEQGIHEAYPEGEEPDTHRNTNVCMHTYIDACKKIHETISIFALCRYMLIYI
jgi:hypothetical protein